MDRAEARADVLERRLNIKKRARADGQAGAPAQTATDLSVPEQDVLAAVDGARRPIEAERAALAQRTEADLRRLTPPGPDIEGPIAAARLDLAKVRGR